MIVKINNGVEFITYDYLDACIAKGIKPILKPIKHKINSKDRPKTFPQNGLNVSINEYVESFLTANHLVL